VADGFTVVLADLRSMKGTFEKEHDAYAGIAAKLTPPMAATGDAGLDETLRAVMDVIAMMHEGLAARIEEHAERLGKTADAYERADIDSHGVFDDLMA
jgi:hypothetical protein